MTAPSGTNELFVTPNLQYFTEGEESGQPISWMIEINGEIYDSGFGINSNTMTYIEDYLAENPDLGISANFENNKLQTDITLFEKQENGLFSKESDSIIQEYHSKEFLSKVLKECNFEIVEIKEFNLHTDENADKLIFICKKIA